MKIRGFSKKTIQSYVYHNQKFIDFLNESGNKAEFQASLSEENPTKRVPKNVTNRDLKAYMAYLMADRGLSPSSVNLALSALKFHYLEVLDHDIFTGIKPPKLPEKLPVVLTKDEIRQMIDICSNKRHKILLLLLYSTGLRVGEAVNLRIKDLQFDEKLAFVKFGKGNKQRFVQLSNQVIKYIQSYLKKRKNKSVYLFNYRGKALSTRQAQRIVKNAALKANIKKKVFCHAFRSSYATHLLESGVDIRFIQAMLGHSKLSTTQRYTEVSKESIQRIKNPGDSL